VPLSLASRWAQRHYSGVHHWWRRRSDKRDWLTGLPGRKAFEADARRRAATHIAYINLDHFKAFNDELGMSIGDIALESVARHCKAIPRRAARVYRLGGNEFVLVTTEPKAETVALLSALREEIRQPNPQFGGLTMTATAGVVVIGPGEPWEEALERAFDRFEIERLAGTDRHNKP